MSNATNEAMKICAKCGGEGTLKIEIFHRQSFSVDSGYIEERPEVCQKCRGEGKTDDEDDEE